MGSTQIGEIKALVRKGTRRLNGFFYAGVVVGVVMGPAVLVAAQVPAVQQFMAEHEAGDPRTMTLFGVVMTLLFMAALGEQFVKVLKDRRLVWTLSQSPHDVVWVYKEISTGRATRHSGSAGIAAGTFFHAYFHFIDGQRATIWLSEAEVDRLVALVAATFPHITTGYDEEIARIYKRDPHALRSNPRHVAGVKQTSASVRYS